MIRPRKLPDNARIGLMTPSSVATKSRLQKGIANLNRLGYKVSKSPGSDSYSRKFGDNERLKSLHWTFTNPEIDMVMASRGGYGCLRILDKIDYSLIRRTRKIMVGYSDITALSLAILKKTGLITFSGPMAASNFAKPLPALTRQSFFNTINGKYLKGKKFDLKSMGAITLAKGTAEGKLIGGNLSIITKLIGTQFLPDLKGAILFLEDVDEHGGRLDNMLAQLSLSGQLHKISAVVFGQFKDCFSGNSARRRTLMAKLFKDYFYGLNIPMIYNLPFGHVGRMLTLPVGLPVRLDAIRAELTYLENPVV